MSITHTLIADPTTGRFDSRNPLGRYIPLPAKIEGLTFVSRTTTSITFSWEADANADTYNVYVNIEPTPRMTGVTGTQTTLTGESPDSSFNIRVSGVNTAGEGPKSDPVTMTTEAAIDTAGLLLASNFEGAVQFATPTCSGGISCFQEITGVCSDTGDVISNPFTVPGTNNTIYIRQNLISGVSGMNSTNIYDYHVNEVKTTTGPYGNNTRAANFKIIQNTKGSNQNVFGYAYDKSNAGTEQLYFRYWVKLEANLKEALDGGWMSFWGFKSSTDLRLSCQLLTTFSEGTPYWYMQLDNQEDANKNGVAYVRYVRESNFAVPVPQGEWMKVECFYSRIGEGRLWWAVNGTVLFDVVPGSNIIIGRSGHRLNRGTFHSIRAATPNTRDVWLDEIEIWDDFPADSAPH